MEWILLGLIIGGWGGYFWRSQFPDLKPKKTKESHNQAQLEQQIKAWEQVMQQAPVGYLQVDEENRLFFCNWQARQLLGIEPELEKEKKLLLQIIRSFELDQLIAQIRSSNKPQQKEWIFHPIVDDPLNPVEKADIPIKGYGLSLGYGHVGIFIEDRQEAITLAQQRDRWAADVAHDLKTPLTSIRLIAESLLGRVDPSLKSWLKSLIKQTIRLSDLVQDILELGQVDMGLNLKLNLEIVDLPKTIQSAWSSLEPLATPKNIKLEYWGASNLTIEADESKVYRLLLNLLDNSIKHSPPLQIISIRVEVLTIPNIDLDTNKKTRQDLIEIEIIDSGSGFAESALPHIFDRFYQSHPSEFISELHGQVGSGLGLAIAHQIVKSHLGTITVANHPETGGAWVKVTLPVSQT